MLLREYFKEANEVKTFAVVNIASNEIIHTFNTDKVARAFSESNPGSKVVWCSRRLISETLK